MPQVTEFCKLPLSLCIITFNEEKNIQRCINSAPFASDIVILDSGSKDQTKALAEGLDARFFEESWRGFGPQKRRAVELAKYDWVLCLDADEELSSELQQEIYTLAQNNFNAEVSTFVDGFKMSRRSFYLGRWLYFGGWYPDYQLRLFNRTRINWTEDLLHESVQGGNIKTLKFDLNHFPFENLSDQILTNNRYSSIGAEQLIKKGKKIYIWQLLIKPFVKFLELYIVKMGFRDGVAGYIIAMGGAYSYFLRYAKAWEKQNFLSQKA